MGLEGAGPTEPTHCELNRLRAENARLRRLLDLRGQDIRPNSEQLAAPVTPPGLVTITSSEDEKLRLYTSLFHARSDVYARRWENPRLGTKGWVPAVAGGWRKGMDRRHARYLPLTREVLEKHLSTGDELFIGLYPMLPDNTCHFLAADFDGPTAMLDALAYVKAAAAVDLSSGLEISQPGRGAHVWIFFTDAVAAATARDLGTVLLNEAAVMRGSMDLRSYDRLFPSQDVLPGEGPGNLIAAPLNGGRRRSGLTVFLDVASLEPFEDQWAYLSTLARVTPAQAARIARTRSRVQVGVEVKSIRNARATRVRPPLPPLIPAELAAGLTIDTTESPAAAVAAFKHAASIASPRFYEMQRLRKSTWGIPRCIQGYDVLLDGSLVLPRGLRHTVSSLVTAAGSKLAVVDARDAGSEISVAFSGVLRDPQAEAVGELLAHDDGILVAPPGSGKTVMACAVIAERSVSTAVLVDRKALADQWRDRVTQFLGVKPGQLGGGRTKLTGQVDIVMLPTLARRDDVTDVLAGYGQVIADECHHVAAAVYEHSVKRIAAQFWLGLTATPKRRDGLGELVAWQLGPIRHEFDQSGRRTLFDAGDGPDLRRELHVHETDFAVPDIDLDDPGALAQIHGRLAVDVARNNVIAADVAAALSIGRNCLVLTRRIAHVDALAQMLSSQGHSPIVLVGGMSVADRRAAIARLAEAGNDDGILVIGTTPFIGEGFDVPALDTLFLAAPLSYDGLLVQCAGRVLRPAAGKEVVVVHDYHDTHVPVLAASLARRMPGYRALHFVASSP